MSPEQKLAQSKASALSFIEESILYPNTPTYFFNIGDHVRFGAMTDAVIEEVLYDGKAYLLRCLATDNNYGHPITYETYRGAFWVEVRPVREFKAEDTAVSDLPSTRLYFMNQSVESLLHRYYHFGVDMNPDYQREFVWTPADKEYLLDSIFKGIDIGKFVFVRRSESEWARDRISYEILDGKQRLNTLIEFFEDRISYKGYTFTQLGSQDRRTFSEHVVSVAELKPSSKNDVLRAFLALNRGGRMMDPAQIEKVESMLAKA